MNVDIQNNKSSKNGWLLHNNFVLPKLLVNFEISKERKLCNGENYLASVLKITAWKKILTFLDFKISLIYCEQGYEQGY